MMKHQLNRIFRLQVIFVVAFAAFACDSSTNLSGGDDDYVAPVFERDSDPEDEQPISGCKPGEIRCYENHVYVCQQDREWKSITDCGENAKCMDGECVDNDNADGDASDGDDSVTDGDNVDGDTSDGDASDGDTSDGDSSDGDTTDGDMTDGDIQPDGDSDLDEQNPTDGDLDESDGDLSEDDLEEAPEYPEVDWPDRDLPACPEDDRYPNNGDPNHPVPIEFNTSYDDLVVCMGEWNFFSFNMQAGEAIVAQLSIYNETDDADLFLWKEVVDNIFEPLRYSDGYADVEQITYNATESGRYILAVNGRWGIIDYGFIVNHYEHTLDFPGEDCTLPLEIDDFYVEHSYNLEYFYDDYNSSCMFSDGPDVVLSVMLDEPTPLTVRVESDIDTMVALRSECDNPSTELGCRDWRVAGDIETLRVPELAIGKYYIIVHGVHSDDRGWVYVTLKTE